MRDLTQGSITSHLVGMAAFIGLGLIFQTAYYLIDLYFVSRLGSEAVAGVSAAGNVFFFGLAASQLISIGAMSLISRAIGAKDEREANLFSDQALSMSLLFAAVLLVFGYATTGPWIGAITADPVSAAHGRAYLYAFWPSLALMFPVGAMMSALRAAGVVMPTMILQTVTVILNALLAPVLITGLGTGVPLGAAGAGLASTIASIVGTAGLVIVFPRVQSYLRIHIRSLIPRFDAWSRITFVGFPSSLEFMTMFVIFAVTYWVIRDFGAEAQAGFGIGGRIMQSIFLPAMAVSFAAAPIAGQNFGAHQFDRVRATFRAATFIGSVIMLIGSLLCHIAPDAVAGIFTSDPAALAVSGEYLRIMSWLFVLSGLIMTASSLFQAMGDTRPSLIASMSRMITFVAPAIWLSFQPWAELHHFWFLSFASIGLQCIISLYLLSRTFAIKLPAPGEAAKGVA
jgi:putative MATE family efflux protein